MWYMPCFASQIMKLSKPENISQWIPKWKLLIISKLTPHIVASTISSHTKDTNKRYIFKLCVGITTDARSTENLVWFSRQISTCYFWNLQDFNSYIPKPTLPCILNAGHLLSSLSTDKSNHQLVSTVWDINFRSQHLHITIVIWVANNWINLNIH